MPNPFYRMVRQMPNNSDYENAAKKAPSARSTSEQALVDKGYSTGMQNVKNLDFQAKQTERRGH